MPEWLPQLLGPIFGGVAVYAGIRVDLAIAKAKAEAAIARADHAHERIDGLMMKGRA